MLKYYPHRGIRLWVYTHRSNWHENVTELPVAFSNAYKADVSDIHISSDTVIAEVPKDFPLESALLGRISIEKHQFSEVDETLTSLSFFKKDRLSGTVDEVGYITPPLNVYETFYATRLSYSASHAGVLITPRDRGAEPEDVERILDALSEHSDRVHNTLHGIASPFGGPTSFNGKYVFPDSRRKLPCDCEETRVYWDALDITVLVAPSEPVFLWTIGERDRPKTARGSLEPLCDGLNILKFWSLHILKFWNGEGTFSDPDIRTLVYVREPTRFAYEKDSTFPERTVVPVDGPFSAASITELITNSDES